MLYTPVFHGSLGILDELLLFCAPLLVGIIILAVASRRARQGSRPRERTRSDPSTVLTTEQNESAKDD